MDYRIEEGECIFIGTVLPVHCAQTGRKTELALEDLDRLVQK